MMSIKTHGRWSSDATAQGYVDNSKREKIMVANIFNKQEIATHSSENMGLVLNNCTFNNSVVYIHK